jgi:hypothetical protein
MKHNLTPHRRAAALLLATAALPFTPLAAQEVPTVNAPPPAAAAPAPPPAPAPAATPVMGPASPVRGATVEHVAPPSAASAANRATRAAPAPRAPVRAARAAAPVRQPAPAPIQAAPAPAPIPTTVTAGATPEVAPVPVAVEPAAAAPEAPATAPAEPAATGVAPWQWALAAAALALVVFGAMLLVSRRRRRAEEAFFDEAVYEEPAYVEPAATPEPALVPIAAAADEVSLADSDRADVDALAASSEPAPNRPWLEFLMRPVRAGTSEDETRVEFELTVGNTGSVPARDVQVSTWMVAAGEGTDMERSLIEPPADANHSEMSIAPGDGARVDGAISLPRDRLRASVLPVIVADARYRLPDGSEGRTHASFAVGLPSGEGIAPFAVDLPSGLRDDVEARLHGEPERV